MKFTRLLSPMSLVVSSRAARRRRFFRRPEAAVVTSEILEDRTLLAAAAIDLTPNEQLLLELVNRARANPQAEAAMYGIDLNDGLNPGTISPDPKQPLAPNQLLIGVARDHSQDMLDRNYFAHTAPPPGHPGGAAYDPDNPPPGSVTFDQRITESGYDWQFVGENIAWGGVTPANFPIDEIAYVYMRHEGLFLSPGHRENILEDAFRELGAGVRYGDYTNPEDGKTYNAIMVSEEFGNSAGDGFITGVVFEDGRNDLDADDFYTIGEQVGSGTITAVASGGQMYSAMIGASGGYALQVPDGTYTVTAAGGAVGDTFVATNVVITGGRNVKVDFDISEPSPPISADSIVGRLDNGVIVIAQSDGTQFVSQAWITWPTSINWQNSQVGDFDGDGKEDMAARDDEGDWWVWVTGDGGFSPSEWGGRWSMLATWNDVMTGDFNGDGRADIAGRAQNGTWVVAASNGSSFTTSSIGGWSTIVTWTDVNSGDFNGDGIDDIVGRANSGGWGVLQSTGSGLNHTYFVGGAWPAAINWNDVNIGDFDNDGRDDIIGRADNGSWYVAYSDGSGFTNHYIATWNSTLTWHDVRVGDFNVDGRADIAGRAGNGTWYTLSPASGTGINTVFTTARAGLWSPAVTWLNVIAGDYNGDGSTDIAGRASNGNWYVALSTESGFANQIWGSWSAAINWSDVERIRVA